ncbi:MAG TPA: EF-Tu/IF-2/RF-3 family GTPase [Methanolinea sp.]|nr:EF-Tu/IF-2/RF-3 family GTPase [Methanolinea sp.]HQK55920.1 EF-Tu/IF-2/RF-3 family GTPase [Methanolinea sp.]
MPNLTVAVIGPEGYAGHLGKKGTVSDITFYNQKRDDVTVTYIEPSRYPEKLSSLFFSLSMAGMALLIVDEINAVFGECVLMLDMAGIKKGVLVLRNYLSAEQVAPLVKGTVVEHYSLHADDHGHLRELFLEEAGKVKPFPEASNGGSVPVDHHFPVKGVGIVVLGGVAEGTIRAHDQLKVLPTGKVAHLRSIQKHDDDVTEARAGDRVGLALKGVEADDLDRGYVLSTNPALVSSHILNGRAELVRYWPAPLKEQMVVYLGHWMQFVPARIAFVNNAGDWRRPEITLRSEKELVYPPGASILIHYLEGGRLRVVGRIVPA